MNPVSATSSIFAPIMQFGFAGMCGVLLVIIVWLIYRLLELLKQTSEIIARNTEAIRLVDERTIDELGLLRSISDRLLARPCIAKGGG